MHSIALYNKRKQPLENPKGCVVIGVRLSGVPKLPRNIIAQFNDVGWSRRAIYFARCTVQLASFYVRRRATERVQSTLLMY